MDRALLYIWYVSVATMCHAFVNEDFIIKRLEDAVALKQYVPVTTPLGNITGIKSIESNIFVGIPYAKPPSRWENAEYPVYTPTPIAAYTLKPMCSQYCQDGPFFCLSQSSEDCLYLNIYQPFDASRTNKKAVMVYIHGGGFTQYSGSSPIHYGEYFAKYADVVLVTINFRLGAIGFLATGNGTDDLEGNYALKDQQMALRWVNENIAFFGGDVNKITLFGHSSGAQSVALHLLNKVTCPMFHRAILQSTAWSLPFRNYDEAKFQTQAIAITLGCPVSNASDMIACLKTKPVDEIIKAQRLFEMSRIDFTDSFSVNYNQAFGPVIDGSYVLGNLEKSFKRHGRLNKDVIIGAAKEEGYYYYVKNFPYMKLLEVARINKRNISEYVRHYPPINPLDSGIQWSKSVTDVTFTCASRQFAKYCDRWMDKVYLYLFDHAVPMNETMWGSFTACYGRSCHSIDLRYIFQVFNDQLPTEDRVLAVNLARYWGNFARTGNPNSPGLKRWKRYRRANKKQLVFKTPNSVTERVPKSETCKFWSKGIGFLS